MKRKTSLVIVGMLLSVLLGASLVGTPPGYAHMSWDCEIDRFNAFMNANDQYTTTLYSWYFGEPVSCATECTPQCEGLSGPDLTTCMTNCISSCNSSRYNSFSSAQSALIAAANQPCSYNPDFCDAAVSMYEQCVFTYNSRMAEPVLDGNGEMDGTWWSSVLTEYTACVTASGIDSCR